MSSNPCLKEHKTLDGRQNGRDSFDSLDPPTRSQFQAKLKSTIVSRCAIIIIKMGGKKSLHTAFSAQGKMNASWLGWVVRGVTVPRAVEDQRADRRRVDAHGHRQRPWGDWQFIAKQPASVPHMLRIVPHAVPSVGHSYEHFPDGFEVNFLQRPWKGCALQGQGG